MEVRDEVVCLVASPSAPIIAYATIPSTRNEDVDAQILVSSVKIWNYATRKFEQTFAEPGRITNMTYSPDGHILAVARSGQMKYLPLSELSPHRVTLYNAHDNYRYLKSDHEHHEPSEHAITSLSFCSVDLDAGDPSSWGGGSRTMLMESSGQPEDEARRKAEERNKEELLRAKMRAGALKRVLYLTILAYGDASGRVRLWDYVQNIQEVIPCPLNRVDHIGVRAITFTTDCRTMAVLYEPGNVVFWSFSRRRPKPIVLTKKREIKSAKDILEARLVDTTSPKIEVDVYEPRLSALGHPNLFFTLDSPFKMDTRRNIHDIAAIPGFGPPTDTKLEEEDDQSKSGLDARARLELSLPPPFPGAEITLREAANIVTKLSEGYTFTGFFLISGQDIAPVPKLNPQEKAQIKKVNTRYAREQKIKMKRRERRRRRGQSDDEADDDSDEDEDIEETDESEDDEDEDQKEEDEDFYTQADSEGTMGDNTYGDTYGDSTRGDTTFGDTTLGDTTFGDTTQDDGGATTGEASTGGKSKKKSKPLYRKYPDLPKSARTGPKVVGGEEIPFLEVSGYGVKTKAKADYLAENNEAANPAVEEAESEDSEDSVILGDDEELKAHYENIIKTRATLHYNEQIRTKSRRDRRSKRNRKGSANDEEDERTNRVVNTQIVVPVPIRIEYIPPLPYPKNALLMAHTHNIERYMDMHRRKMEFIRDEIMQRKLKMEEALQKGIPINGPLPEDIDPEEFDDLDFIEPENAKDKANEDGQRINDASTTLDLTKIYTRNPDPLSVSLDTDYEKQIVAANKRLPVAAVTLPPLSRAQFDEEQEEYLYEVGLVHLGEGAPRTYELVGDLLIRDQVREYNFPLYDLKQIQVGKMSVELGSSAASQFPDKCCFSLIGSKDQLHLVADNAEVAEQWINGIRHILWRVGRYLSTSKRSPSLFSDRIPPVKSLDGDLLSVVAGFDPNEKLTGTQLSNKTKVKERGETFQDTSANSVEGIFTTPCHTYRVLCAADYVNMILEVRVDHERVFDKYADGKDIPKLEMRKDLVPKGEIKDDNANDDLASVEEKILKAQKSQNSDTYIGDWGYITVARTASMTTRIAPIRDGKFVIAAERSSSNFKPEWISLHLENHIPFQETARAMVEVDRLKNGKVPSTLLYPNDGINTVSIWSVIDGNMIRYPIGLHDGQVTAINPLPTKHLAAAGSKYTIDDEGYIMCSSSLDETIRLWTFAAADLDASRDTFLRPLQVVMRPLPLRQLTSENAAQGRGPEHVKDKLMELGVSDSDPESPSAVNNDLSMPTNISSPAAAVEVAQIEKNTAAQKLAEEMKERARKEKLKEKTREYVLNSTKISSRTRPTQPGPKLKQLNALLHLKERQYIESIPSESD